MKQKRKVRVWLCAALAACAIASIALIVAIQQSAWADVDEADDFKEQYYIGHNGIASESEEMFGEPEPPSLEDIEVPPPPKEFGNGCDPLSGRQGDPDDYYSPPSSATVPPELANDPVNTGTCIPPE